MFLKDTNRVNVWSEDMIKFLNEFSGCHGLAFNIFDAFFNTLDVLKNGTRLLLRRLGVLGICLFKFLD